MKINKIKNFEGHWLTCQKCGRLIKHGYETDGIGCYGSECVYEIAGVNREKAKKQINKLLSNEKIAKKMMNNKERYSWEVRKEALGFTTDEELYNYIVETY